MRRPILAILVTLFVVAAGQAPAAATTISSVPWDYYAEWPPNYCAARESIVSPVSSGSSTVQVAARNWSLKALTSSCDDPSTASQNTFASLAFVEVYSGGTWNQCGAAYYSTNSNGEYFDAAVGSISNCGKNRTYRLIGQWRITYGGLNQTANLPAYWYWSN